jgi:hypothetical protein
MFFKRQLPLSTAKVSIVNKVGRWVSLPMQKCVALLYIIQRPWFVFKLPNCFDTSHSTCKVRKLLGQGFYLIMSVRLSGFLHGSSLGMQVTGGDVTANTPKLSLFPDLNKVYSQLLWSLSCLRREWYDRFGTRFPNCAAWAFIYILIVCRQSSVQV